MELFKEWMDAQFITVGCPQIPFAVGGVGSLSSDSGMHLFLCKHEITAEAIPDVGVHSLQERG